ncbi:hypothetical protein PENSPDRAFT_648713 [Peniophora sp. CONT]|nr:hypothetical protein PENSPDRAFT_648713 [Peniophora sp. CONT]
MDSRAFRDILCEGPQPALLEAVIAGREADALPLLDAELDRSLVRMQRLKECRNWLASPIHRLHPEILQIIVFMYAHDNDELFDMRWVRLLHVCKRWHDILVHTPVLWSFMDVSSSDLAIGRPDGRDASDIQRVAAQRSRVKLWPLTVRIRTNMYLEASLPQSKLALISSGLWNPRSLSSLTAGGRSALIHTLLQNLASQRQSSLGELSLHQRYHDEKEAESRYLINAILDRYTPKLHHLSLIGLDFSWTRIRNLRTLRIEYGPSCRPKDSKKLYVELINALCRCPLLERLHLELPPVSFDEITFRKAASLPVLQEVSLKGSDVECHNLLQSLVHLPAAARIIIIVYNGSRKVKYHSPLASILGHHASQGGAPVIRTIVLAFDRMEWDMYTGPTWVLGIVGRTCLEASTDEWNEHTFLPPHRENPNSYLGIETSFRIRAEDLSNLDIIAGPVRDILRTWPLSGITDLDMRLAAFKPAHLNTLFFEFPTATTVVVRPESQFAFDLLTALRVHLREHKQRVFGNIVFDAEKILRDDLPVRRGLRDGVLARRTLMLTLLYCAEADHAGVPLDTMEIVNEGLSPKTESLLELSADLDWTELSNNLLDGFVCMGVIHSIKKDRDGLRKEFPRVAAS